MISTEQIQHLLDNGGTVVGEGGEKIGKVGQLYLDDETGQPEWVTTKTGTFGGAETFVPIAQASVADSELRVPYSKDKIKDAPQMQDSEGHLSQDQEAELYRYYGLDSDSGLAGGDRDTDRDYDRDRAAGAVGRDTSGPTTDEAMTRSEETLRVGTQKRETGKARLRKYVVTENVTKTVPVSREEVRVEREPITEANRGEAMAGGDLTDEEHEVTLSEEQVVVDKETVPVERVRMDTDTVTEDQQVSEEVRKEQIEADTPDTPKGRGKR